MSDPVLHVPPHVAEERAAAQVQRPVIGLLFGGWRNAVNPATIAYMEVWSTGNAFAAFPVMMAGIGLPLLILQHGADPAILGAIGMLTGYCGTLLTPMAANFNIVPAVLLELPDQYGVIRSQIPTALGLMAVNILLMIVLVFR